MSGSFKYTVGLNNVGSYQVAGSPYVTASVVAQDVEKQIEFPRVTNNINVKLNENIYNSIFLNGQNIYYINATPGTTDDEVSRTITTWISASFVGSSNNGIIIGGTNTASNLFCIREKDGNFQAIIRDNVGIKTINDIVIESGWFHLAFVADSGNNIKAFVNGVEATKSPTAISNTVGANLGGGLVIGPPGFGDGTYAYRDSILWNTALSDLQIENLYNARNDYRDPAFNVAEKLVWIKPTEAVAGGPVASLVNSGTSFGNMTLTAHNGSEVASVIADSPFGTGDGELRIHYRSTGSLPNVANRKHYWTLDTKGEEIKMNVKSKEIYLSTANGDCDFSIHADLTNIPASRMYQHTGSGVDE